MANKKNGCKIAYRSCDVLIIGGGSAGLRAAIEAHDAGSQVLIVSKNRRGDPHIQCLHAVASMQLLELWIHKIIG